MTKKLTIIVFFFLTVRPFLAQDCALPRASDQLDGNNVQALITGGGSLFFDGDDANFQVPAAEGLHTIFAQGLWLGGFDPAGNLKVAAQTYGLAQGRTDYFAGPLDETGSTSAQTCQGWDRIWTVYRYQIEAHIVDFLDNDVIDDPIPEIMGWPGKGNPHFAGLYGFNLPSTPQGLAPFFDLNGDGIYDPLTGDFPIVYQSDIPPEKICWSVFNDAGGLHTESLGDPLQMEVQLTSWAYQCTENTQLNNTIFLSYKLINRGIEPLDSLYFGQWLDFDLGCFKDDFIGSAPALNSFFVYNQDNEDDVDCGFGVTGYGENPPVQAITALNHDLSHLMYYVNPGTVDPLIGMTDPNIALEHYHYLTGRWRDGTPLTYGGTGYDPSLSNPITDFAFPGDPNDPDEWSAYNSNLTSFADRRAVSSIALGELMPGTLVEVDLGYSFFREPGANHLENVTAMYAGVEALQEWYDNGFEEACTLPAICSDDCIWAGDLNADGIANHCDLLALAVTENAQGPTRGAPYNWSPQDGQAWTDTQDNGANYKHLDADGNGSVDFADFLLSEQHYSLTRPGYEPPPPVYREGPELLLDVVGGFDFDNLSAGQSTGLARIRLTIDVPDLYALAFSLEYDTAYFEFMAGQPSGFNLGGRVFRSGLDVGASSGQFDFAKVATGGTLGEGLLTLLEIQVKEAFLHPLPADTSLIRFKNIKAIRQDGSEIEIGGTTVVARFPGVIVDTEEAFLAQDIRLFPNPTNGQLELRFPGRQLERIALFDLTGKQLWLQKVRWTDTASLDLAYLPRGIYFVSMQLDGENIMRRIVLQ